MSDVRGFPATSQEAYLTRAQVAERMGVSVATIDRFIASGCPSERFGLRSRRLLWSQVIAWARTRRVA